MARRDITGAVDFAYLENYAAGDSALVEEVLGLFREQLSMWLRLLDPNGPPQGWRDAAHTLKGSALGVGAFALAEVCGAAEATPDTELGARLMLFERIRTAADAALSDIAAYTHERALQSLKGRR
ncbi:Hpt domain-containing protein [Caulobacter sp. S45]|uniref:Hpt domain-containing protein n=1 Tax=Caulobacter sp. S45 TaxID=1641861 RepID=UPI00131C2B54|nr:Hpt domain-containing protein [Caulobacter sp. S45]